MDKIETFYEPYSNIQTSVNKWLEKMSSDYIRINEMKFAFIDGNSYVFATIWYTDWNE